MAKQLGENEFDKLEGQGPSSFEGLDRWSPELEEELSNLLRALRRKKGFSLFFVQCSPALGERIIEAIQKRFPQKKLARFELDRQSETLYRELRESYQTEQFEIACMTGIEQTLYAYEDTKRLAGWSSEDIYSYSWKGVPTLLSHLNYHRELFEANLPIALIFFVPRFAIDYFIQRAPDFFDWRSGFFKFVESSENLQKYFYELVSQKYRKYLDLTTEQRMEKILEIKDKIFQIDSSDSQQKSNLLREQGRIFESGGSLIQALECQNLALTANPQNYNAWHSKSCILHSLERYEEAIESCDRALAINSNYHFAWENRGNALANLGCYKDAIANYDRSLEIQPNNDAAWYGKGNAFLDIGQIEEALNSYNQALKTQADRDGIWYNRGIAFMRLGRYEEALESFHQSLKIKPDKPKALIYRGIVRSKLKDYHNAIADYKSALELDPNNYRAWYNQGIAFARLKHYEEAVESFSKAISIKSDYASAYYNRACTYALQVNVEEALQDLREAISLDPSKYRDMAIEDPDFAQISSELRFQTLIKS